jgi:hypothetical protein
LPDEARDLPVAEVETLTDLVDVAIDSDNPVLESPGGDAYHVVHDGYRYTFETPPEPEYDDPLTVGEAEAPSDGEGVATANGGRDPDENTGE